MRIFLIGFMGSGKTHWGRIWASEIGIEFYDIDELVEHSEKKSIAALFDEKGEKYFREKESIVLKQTPFSENCIISCGGGAPCYEDNMEWMNANGITLFLEGSSDFLYKNIVKNIAQRPLLKNLSLEKLMSFIESTLAERNKFYHKAQFRFSTATLNNQTIHQII